MNDHDWVAGGKKAGKEAGATFGLHAAWVLRAATSGGPAGIAGGAIGGGVGAAIGALGGPIGMTGGALLGNFVGQMAQGGVKQASGAVAMANPTVANKFERATNDFTAVIGRKLVPAVEFFTSVARTSADWMAGGEGKSRHAAVASGAGQGFGSLNEVYRSIVGQTIMMNAAKTSDMIPAGMNWHQMADPKRFGSEGMMDRMAESALGSKVVQ
jgi:hypothetical protein